MESPTLGYIKETILRIEMMYKEKYRRIDLKREIPEKFEVSMSQIMNELGIPKPTLESREKSEPTLLICKLAKRMNVTPSVVKSILFHLYWEKGCPISVISKMYSNIWRKTILQAMRELEIPLRTQKDAVRLSFAKLLSIPSLLYQMLIGLILSDGHLSRRAITARFTMNMSFKTFEFFELILLPIF
ncbi:MAG: hypothetical protein ACFFCQ_13210, partial [Promethearchaeota archaeon]